MTAPCCPHPIERHAYNGCAECGCGVLWTEHPERDRDQSREGLASLVPILIAERDRARALCREACDIAIASEAERAAALPTERSERIAAIRTALRTEADGVPAAPSVAQLCTHARAYACHECEASRCVACDVKVASRSEHVQLYRVCPRCL